MIITLYDVVDSPNVMGKQKLNPVSYNITFKEAVNIITPTVRLRSEEPILKNYAYIPEFERYYFITSTIIRSKQIYELHLECDVLDSFRSDILISHGVVTRSETGNKFFDGGLNSEVRKEVVRYYSTIEPELAPELILVTIK